ncbi:MAG: CopG family ribbon-helix-helix protein [Azospirillaceae bacterium]|nr:CopG family ribbon-helix-helix protein [Azospirillaceae bacterium]
MTKTSLDIHLGPDLSDQVTAIAKVLDRPASWVVDQAIRDFIAVQEGHLRAIEEGIRAADAGKVVPHEDVVAWVNSWGTDNELPMPSAD